MTVYVEAVHTVKPLTNTAFDAYVAWYGEYVIPAMHRAKFGLMGAWKRTGGPMGQDVLLLRFDDLSSYTEAGLALRADKKFLEGYSQMAGKFVITESTKLCAPVPYADEARLEKQLGQKPEKPRQYMQAQLIISPGGQPKFYEAVGKLAALTDAGDFLNLVAAYETTIGQRGEATDIWVMPRGLTSIAYRAGDPLAELMVDLRAAAPEESTYYLNPLPYSPLQ
ncbi:hypothetical protein AYO38_07110 [bacterium SCGC AG-212-C10]|nr:hypothetical protein AYO38_07110 [bacterium SCGC AG-212-C10]